LRVAPILLPPRGKRSEARPFGNWCFPHHSGPSRGGVMARNVSRPMQRVIAIAVALSLGLLGVPRAEAQAGFNGAYLPKQVNTEYFDAAATGGMHAASELG